MAPILALVVETFVQHLHDLDELLLVVCHLGDLVHLRARWTPRIVGRGIPDFGLDVRVTFSVVLGHTQSPWQMTSERSCSVKT